MFTETEYIVPFLATRAFPDVGEGFSSYTEFDRPHLDTAIEFVREENFSGFIEKETVNQITTEVTTDSDSQVGMSGSFKEIVKVAADSQSYAKVFEKHVVFVYSYLVIKKTLLVRNPKLLAVVDPVGLGRSRFVRKYGNRFVSGIDFGGRVSFIYVFETRDMTETSKIKSSISMAYAGAQRFAHWSIGGEWRF